MYNKFCCVEMCYQRVEEGGEGEEAQNRRHTVGKVYALGTPFVLAIESLFLYSSNKTPFFCGA